MDNGEVVFQGPIHAGRLWDDAECLSSLAGCRKLSDLLFLNGKPFVQEVWNVGRNYAYHAHILRDKYVCRPQKKSLLACAERRLGSRSDITTARATTAVFVNFNYSSRL